MGRLFLSPPDVGDLERRLLLDAFDSNWIAPLGPHVDAFEREFAALLGTPEAAALSSGTAALQLALLLVGVGPGDHVIVPTFTFVATANAARYLGARPVFLDSERVSWNLDPDLLHEELAARARRGNLPAAVVAVDLYGQCADWDPIIATCARYEVPVVEDAAEALGATYRGQPAGTLASVGTFSFNGNKIITTSGGGMLIAHDPSYVRRARYLASQARDAVAHYEHREVGYNYRLSNLLAALGRGQLGRLEAFIARRREINAQYRHHFSDVPGIDFIPNAPYGTPTNWLTVITIDEQRFGASPSKVREHLERLDIESRPAWKPMHLQPLFAGSPTRGGGVAESIFHAGLCLPSGTAMTDADIERVAEAVLATRSG